MQNDERLGIASTAKMVGVSVKTVRRWTAAGNFPKPVVLGPSTRYWLRSVVAQWLRERGVQVDGGAQ